VEEFDAVIIDMPSLTQPLFDKLVSAQPRKLKTLGDQILTLLDTERSVYSIFSEPIEQASANSWDWLFAWPNIQKVKPSSSLNVIEKDFEGYFRGLDQWTCELQVSGVPSKPVALNKSKKMIATKIVGPSLGRLFSGGSLYFLPPLTSYSPQEAIETLIDVIQGKAERAEYPWREKIVIPGLSEIQREIEGFEERINEICKKREEALKQYTHAESYRDVFSINDELQVKAVKRMLSDIGIESDLTKPSHVVDLLGKDVAVEVTSDSDKITTKSDSLTQVSRFIQTERKAEKVILVANTHKRLALEQRTGKDDFSPEAKDFLESLKVCCMSAFSLYSLWKKVQEKHIPPDKARSLIFDCRGELRL
jgi:tRNA(Ser,Leu) C12 N-acetylase TAN1